MADSRRLLGNCPETVAPPAGSRDTAPEPTLAPRPCLRPVASNAPPRRAPTLAPRLVGAARLGPIGEPVIGWLVRESPFDRIGFDDPAGNVITSSIARPTAASGSPRRSSIRLRIEEIA